MDWELEITDDSNIRAALQEFAGDMIDQGPDVYAQVALVEVKRLDRKWKGADVSE
jgi:hypothetical protein